jgi:hypothetical protein
MDILVPDMYYQSIYKINYKKLKKMKIKCLLFDLDNTVAPYSKTEPDKKIMDLFMQLQPQFKVIIMSNSGKKRLRPFKEKLNVDVAYSSMKPLKKKYKKILKLYHLEPSEVAMIGDQLLTDIFGANRMGMLSIFVNSISPYEKFFTKINRHFERKIIKRFNKRGILIKGEYYE